MARKKIFLMLMIGLMLAEWSGSAPVSGANPGDTDAQETAGMAEKLKTADAHLQKQRFDLAIPLAKEILARDSEPYRLYRAVTVFSESLQRQGKSDEAARVCRAFLDSFPRSPYAESVKGRILNFENRYLYLRVSRTGLPGKKSAFGIYGQNIPYIDFELFRVTIVNDRGEIKETPVKQWRWETPKSGEWFNEEIEFETDEAGIYVVRAVYDLVDQSVAVAVSNIDAIVKLAEHDIYVFAFDRSKNLPVEGVEVVLGSADLKFSLRGKTDSAGLFHARDDSGLVTQGWVSHQGSHLSLNYLWNPRHQTLTRGHLYTDRPLYRPGHAVHYKGILRVISGERLVRPDLDSVSVRIRNPKWQVVHEDTPALTPYGSFSGTYKTGEDAILGEYHIEVQSRHHRYGWITHYGRFKVEAYRKPEFIVDVKPDRPWFLTGETAAVTAKVDYFFGGDVANATAVCRIFAGRIWGDDRLDDRDDISGWYKTSNDRFHHYGGYEELIREFSGKTDTLGIYRVVLSDTLLGDLAKHPAAVRVEVRVTDASRFSAVGDASLRLYPSALRVQTRTDRYYYDEGDTVRMIVGLSDPDNQPKSGEVTAILQRYVRESSAEAYQDEGRVDVYVGPSGAGWGNLKPKTPGYYRAIVRAKDPQGRPAEAETHFSFGRGSYYIPDFSGGISIKPDREYYEVGQTAKVVIVSDNPCLGLFSVEGRKLHSLQAVTLLEGANVFEVPITVDRAPNLQIHFVGGAQGERRSDRIGIGIVPRDMFLNVSAATGRSSYRPGEKIDVSVSVRDRDRNPVKAEFSAVVVDASILSLHPRIEDDIRKSFWTDWPARVNTHVPSFEFRYDRKNLRNLLMAAGEEATDEVGARDGLYDLRQSKSKMEPAAAPAPSSEKHLARASVAEEGSGLKKPRADKGVKESQVRRAFAEVAYWAAHGVTDKNGNATFAVAAPDNLTEWKIIVIAHDSGGMVGETTGAVQVTKDLLVRLEPPRFLRDKDDVTFAVIANNRTARPIPATLRLSATAGADRLVWAGPAKRMATIPANGQVRLEVPARVQGEGTVTLRAEVISRLENDAVERVIPVKPHGMDVAAGAAGYLRDRASRTISFPERSAKEGRRAVVRVSPSLALVAFEGLDYLVGFPYGCVEQTMSRFLPNVAVAKTFRKLGIRPIPKEEELPAMVSAGLRRLYDFQHGDGGWGWWKEDQTDPFMTAYVVYGLALARETDFPIEDRVLRRGIQSLKNQLPKMDHPATRAFALAALADAGETAAVRTELDRSGVLDPFKSDPTALAFAVIAAKKSGARQTAELFGSLTDAIRSSGGAAWVEGKGFQHGWQTDAIEATAWTLEALLEVEPSHESVIPMVAWLVSNRGGGYWISTKTTAFVLLALSKYLRFTPEHRPDFTYAAALQGDEILSGRFLNPSDSAVYEIRGMDAPDTLNLSFFKTGQGILYYSVTLHYYDGSEGIQPGGTGEIGVARQFFVRTRDTWVAIQNGGSISSGATVRVLLTIEGNQRMRYIMLRDPFAAGAEVIRNFKQESGRWGWTDREFHDDHVAYFFTWYNPGAVEYEVQATLPGTYHILPSEIGPMYSPDVRAHSGEFILKVTP